MRSISKKIILALFAVILSVVIYQYLPPFGFDSVAQDQYGLFTEHRYEEFPPLTLPDSMYLSYTEFRNDVAPNNATILAINLATWDKIIRFDTAEELYRFSLDVSYNLKYTPFETKLSQAAIEKLLSLHYQLGNDIDYSVMKSRQFNPIGYNFSIEGVDYQQSFKGIFDGNGFEISNLYFSGYNQLTETLNPGTETETQISYIEYYSMFAYNEGTIQNLGIINPTFEFNFESTTLFKAANLVGINKAGGNVNHVYVIDYRPSALVAGIRMVSTAGQAAGVMFDNYGTFEDAYYVSRVVINASFGSRFTVQPVLYENHDGGVIDHLAYDATLYQTTVTIGGSSYNITTPNVYATGLTTAQLRNTNAVLGSGWFFYPAQNQPNPKYPSPLGLTFNPATIQIALSETPGDQVTFNGYFEINDAWDMVRFSRILNYTRQAGLTPYRELNYVITQSLDMSIVSPEAYQTPTVEFTGSIAGINDEVVIYNMSIIDGVIEVNYYAGMFGIFSGSIYNLIFYQASITLTQTETNAGVPIYAGLIAGSLNQGVARNILVDVDINLGNKTIGELHVGALFGQASGLVTSVLSQGEILFSNAHVMRNDILINPRYYVGGLIGSSGLDQLILTDAYNLVDIYGPGTQTTSILSSGAPITYIGGVIGYVENTLQASHVLGFLTNAGTLKTYNYQSQYTNTQYVGGVIGFSAGLAYQMNYTFGQFYQRGTIDVLDRGNTQVISAGVLVSGHSEPVEFIHLFNEAESNLLYYTEAPITGSFDNLSYTTLIYNVGSDLTLSQSINKKSMDLYNITSFSGIYESSSNPYTLIRFVENRGDIVLKNHTLSATATTIAGFSTSSNIDYLNVEFKGNIYTYNLTMQTTTVIERQLFISGIATRLSQNRFIRNSIVSGEITAAGISTNPVNRTPSNNIYIGGFVNYNESGNMDPNGTDNFPKATMGIINSINQANITSTYGMLYRGITGHANVFAGGLVTFNDGDIQDSANIGDVRFENLSNVDEANVTFNEASTVGGAVTKYRYGVVIGGVSAAVFSQKSRIYDSSNSGSIIALSRNFARAGGILGIAIYREIEFGNAYTPYTSVSNANIGNSILSNCINYGDVSALTISIAEYSMSTTTQTMSGGITNNFRFDITMPISGTSYQNSFYSTLSSGSVRLSTRVGTEQRPGINAAAGGVIGYGLSVMRRMMNHGQISSTDVAGGVVGATVVILTEYVRIDTAINYGTVRAFNRGTSGNGYANFMNVDIMDYETIRDGFYAVDDPFIFPNTLSDIRLFPENKRGIGGIFGRLQRAANQYMYGNNDANSTFNFIVNMDPNVDLVGRLDQVYNYYSSLRFFDFRNAVYYSARKNDTTQAVFTGISFFYDNSNTFGNSLTAYRNAHDITITSRKYEYSFNSGTGQWMRTTYQRTMNRTEISLYGRRFTRIGPENPTYLNYQEEVVSRSAMPAHGGGGWSIVSGSTVAVGTLSEYKYVTDLPLYNQVWDIESTKVINSTSSWNVPNGYYLFGVTLPVPTITEEALDPQGQYVYDPSFEMQTDPVLQQYIYFAENGNLSPTFINSRPNGMYVLSTSSGSTFGSILPANLVFGQVLPLSQSAGLPKYDIDYDLYMRIMPSSDPFYTTLQSDYQALFQTVYSDKSQLLDGNNLSLVLREDEGSKSKLYLPTVIQPATPSQAGVITFNINLQLLEFDQNGLAEVNYRITDEILPINAVVAKTISEYYGLPYGSDVSAFISSYQALLEQYVDPNTDPEDLPDLDPLFNYTFDLNNLQTGLITIGYFTSYSQVAQFIPSFLNPNYYTDYEVRLNVTYNASHTLPYLWRYQVDGGSQQTTITPHLNGVANNSIRFLFRNPNAVLPVGSNVLDIGSDEGMLDNVTLEYFDDISQSYVMVDYDDYTLSSVLVQNATQFPFEFTLGVNPSLRSGVYRVGFRLLPYEDRTYYTFDKGASSDNFILELEHYSSGIVTPSGNTITSYVNFGYTFDFSDTTLTEVLNPDAQPYETSLLYYELPFIGRIVVSDLATITNVTVNPVTYTANNFRIYNISYTVVAGNGTSTRVYQHQIIEREIGITNVFRNNNKVVMTQANPVVVTREAASTLVSIDFGIDESYGPSIYNLIADNPNSHFVISPDDVNGVEFSVSDKYLVFDIQSEAVAGLYTFEVGYQRTGDPVINLGTVYIFKSLGTNAYLIDIQFAELATETSYAQINVSDANGIINPASPYSPSIYFAGIDYDGADVAGVTNFRVDGQVSNIPLDEYIPFFLNYLPLGATVARKLPGGSYTDEVSGPDDPNVFQLAADFTSQEGISEGDDIIVTYRVTSENGLNVVYYHITVIDITYNVSYIFEVIYEGNDLQPNLDGIVIVINVRNMTTNLPVTDAIVQTLPQFSSVLNYNNSTNLMFLLGQENYRFRFGRNKSGYFSFSVKLLDPNNYLYDYKIELNGVDELVPVNSLDLSSSDTGRYYYINSSIQNRTRNFTITIYNARERIRDYGFTDQDPSWNRKED